MRKSARENQHQIDLNYSSIHFSSDRDMKFECMKFSTFQTLKQVNPEVSWMPSKTHKNIVDMSYSHENTVFFFGGSQLDHCERAPGRGNQVQNFVKSWCSS